MPFDYPHRNVSEIPIDKIKRKILLDRLLTVYFIKDRLKIFVGQRGSVVHHFHPEILVEKQESLINQ